MVLKSTLLAGDTRLENAAAGGTFCEAGAAPRQGRGN